MDYLYSLVWILTAIHPAVALVATFLLFDEYDRVSIAAVVTIATVPLSLAWGLTYG